MSGQSSSSYGDTDPGTDRASSTTTSSSIRWAPHGRGMTACLVVVNVVLVGLVYLYFWRVFSRKSSAASSPSASNPTDHDDDASSTASTPPSSPPTSQDQHDRLVASLPTFVARSGSGAGAGVECAVCIAELRDGDHGRELPRCGHQFHAACVDAWLRRRHTTCPLCRACVVVAAGEEAGPKGSGVTGTTTTAAALEDMDAPV